MYRYHDDGCNGAPRSRGLVAPTARRGLGYNLGVANKQGWFAIFEASALVIADVLAAAAKLAPGDARPDEGFRVVAGELAVVDVGSAYGHVDAWAQAVSKVARRTTISFFVFEGQWGYQVCDRGAVIGGMEGYPLERPALFGALDKAARLAGTTRAVLERYGRAAGDDDAPRFAGDRHAPSDDRVHLDLARRLGIPAPGGKRMRTLAAPPATTRRTWQRIGKQVARPSARPARRSPRAPRRARREGAIPGGGSRRRRSARRRSR